MSYCKVKNCRYPDTHVTIGHKCGKCGGFGHGQMECGKEYLINSLYKYKDDILPMGKLEKQSSNSCKYCEKSGNRHLKNCPQNGVSIIDNISFDTDIDLKRMVMYQSQLKDGCYLQFHGCQGSTWFARNNKNKIEFLFMHSDSWGQYGEDSSDVPRLNAFKEGYTHVEYDYSKNKI